MNKTKKRLPAKPAIPTIGDGTVSVKVKGGAHDGETLSLDLINLILAIEPVEAAHKVAAGFKANPKFTTDLATAFRSAGVPGCTPTMAYDLWCFARNAWYELKKDTP